MEFACSLKTKQPIMEMLFWQQADFKEVAEHYLWQSLSNCSVYKKNVWTIKYSQRNKYKWCIWKEYMQLFTANWLVAWRKSKLLSYEDILYIFHAECLQPELPGLCALNVSLFRVWCSRAFALPSRRPFSLVMECCQLDPSLTLGLQHLQCEAVPPLPFVRIRIPSS